MDTSVERAKKDLSSPLTSGSDVRLNLTSQVPTFWEYRRKDDAGAAPDKGFRKQLKKLNPDYEVVWDWGCDKWQICEFPSDGGEPYQILTVEAAGKSYRELGADILLRLQMINPAKVGTKEIIAYLDEMDAQVRRRKKKDFANKIEAISHETFNYAQNILQVQVPKMFSVERMVSV